MTGFQSVIDTWCTEQTCSTWRGRRHARKADVVLRKCHLDVLLLRGVEADSFNPLRLAMQQAARNRWQICGLDRQSSLDSECIVVTGRPEYEYSHTPRDTDHFVSVRWLPDALRIVAGLAEAIRDSYPNFFLQHESDPTDRSDKIWSLFGSFLYHLLNRRSYTDYIKYSKWWSTWFLAKFLDQELPVPPNQSDELPFTGDFRRFFRMRLLDAQKGEFSRLHRRAWRFFNTVQQIKRCSNPVPSDFVASSLGKHFETMGREKHTHLMADVPLEDQESVLRTVSDDQVVFRLDLQDFRRKVKSVMRGLRVPRPHLLAASTSAGFDISRDAGGQQAEIYHLLGGVGPMRVLWTQPRRFCCEKGDEMRRFGVGKVLSQESSIFPAEIWQIIGDYEDFDNDVGHGENQWELIPPTDDSEGDKRSKICGCKRSLIYKCGQSEAGYHTASFEVPDELVRHDDLLAMLYRPLDGVWEVRGIPIPRAVEVRDRIITDQFRSCEDDFHGGFRGCWVAAPGPRLQKLRGAPNYVWRSFGGCDSFGCRPTFRKGLLQGELNPIRRHDRHDPAFWPGALRARIVPVLEPWKVRTISAGESMPYWYARYYQKSIHDYLRQIPQFQYIGQPLTGNTLSTFFKRFSAPRLDDWIVSGDYSAATDGVSSTLTMICHEESTRSVRDPLSQHILDKVIDSHLCVYDGLPVQRPSNETMRSMMERGVVDDDFLDVGGRSVPPNVLQNDGQLMGSVESFPYLCLINFVGTWMTVFPEIEDFRDVPVLVNGDDILFFADKPAYARWLLGLDFMGFTRSIGKNFHHRHFGYMNSIPFHFDRATRLFETFPYYNVGLLYGQQRVGGGGAGKMQVMELSDGTPGGSVPLHLLQPKAIEGASNPARAAARFARLHRDYLLRISRLPKTRSAGRRYLNWYVPVEFGGLGMMAPLKSRSNTDRDDEDEPKWGFQTTVTRWQMSLWYRCFNHYSKPFLRGPAFPKIVTAANNCRQHSIERWRIGVFSRDPMITIAPEAPQPRAIRIQRVTPIDLEVNWGREFVKFWAESANARCRAVTKKMAMKALNSHVVFSDIVHPKGLLPSLRKVVQDDARRRARHSGKVPADPPGNRTEPNRIVGIIPDSPAEHVIDGVRHLAAVGEDGWFLGWRAAPGDDPQHSEDEGDEEDDSLDDDFVRYEDACQDML